MNTLVYFASGPYREEYEKLNFDKIYLIDICFRRLIKNSIVFSNGKTTCVGMDCLESIEFLKSEGVKIDFFVSLNEGLLEGGGFYPINSDMFLGYAMPLFKDQYIHIMDKDYYNGLYRISMDLPYKVEEIKDLDIRFINPSFFSENYYHRGNAKVLQMDRLKTDVDEFPLKSSIKLKIIHDSIWNHYNNLDALIITMKEQGQRDFFDNIPKVINMNTMGLNDILDYCKRNKFKKIGFTPWGRGCYKDFLRKLNELKSEYPNEISLFYLNKNDYKQLKEFASRRIFV